MSERQWTRQDTITLLQWIAAHNGREPGKSDVLVWTAAAQTGRWVPEFAHEAVTQFHLRNSDRLIGPADVHAFVRSKVEDVLQRAEAEELKRSRPVYELISGEAERRAIPAADDPDPLYSLTADCDFCKARDGEPCTVRTSNGIRPVRPHDSRHEKLRAQAPNVSSGSDEKCPTCAAPPQWLCMNIVTGRYRSRGDHGERDGQRNQE